MRQTVTDVRGARWTVRARHVRGAGTPAPDAGPRTEALRVRLVNALAREPVPLPGPGNADVRLPSHPLSDPVDAALAHIRRDVQRPGTALAVAVGAASSARPFLDRLRTPRSGTWEVELVARGRFRRWARWTVSGSEAAARVVAVVRDELAAGRVPEPPGATLVEVVDHRPPVRWQPVP